MLTVESRALVRPRSLQMIRLLTLVPLLVGLALTAVVFVWATQGLVYAGPTSAAEGNQFAATLRVARGEPLYLNYHELPYVFLPYTPVFYFSTGVVSGLLQLDQHGALLLSRGVSLAAALGIGGMTYVLARGQGASGLAAATTGVFFLSVPFLDRWAFTSRPDTLAVLVTFLAAAALLRWPERWWIGASIAVLAFFTKQTMVSLPVAAALWFWFSGRQRAAIGFGVAWAGIIGVLVFGINTATAGTFLLNVFYAHLNPANGFDVALKASLLLPLYSWFAVILALGQLIMEIRRRSLSLVGGYWIVSVLMLVYTSRGTGAAQNYFIEPSAVASVLAAPFLSTLMGWLRAGQRRHLAVGTLVAIGAIVWGIGVWLYWHQGGEILSERPVAVPEIAQAERIWSEEPSLVVFAGKPLLVSDPFSLSQMVSADHFDVSLLVSMVRSRSLELILVRGDARTARYLNGQIKWPHDVLTAITQFYHVSAVRGPYWLYVPNPPQQRRENRDDAGAGRTVS